MVVQKIDVQKFIEDSQAVLLNPKSYFDTMPKKGGYAEPLIKAIVYGVIAGAFSLIWWLIGLSGIGGGTGVMLGGGGILAPIKTILIATIGVFVGGGIVLLVSTASSGSNSYEACVRVSAALMVLLPINAALSFLFGISTVLGILVSLAVSLYGLFLLLCAVVVSLDAKEKPAMIVIIALAVLLVMMNGCALMAMRFT